MTSLAYDKPDWSEREKLSFEKSVLGLYLSSHPLANFETEVIDNSTLRFGDGEDIASGRIDISRISSVRMCGIVSGLKIKQSRKGNRFCVFTLEDFTGHGECVVFPQTFDRHREHLHNDEIIAVTGRPEENGNSIKVIVDDIKPIYSVGLNEKRQSNGTEMKNGVTIRIDSNRFDPGILNGIKQFLETSISEEPWNRNICFDIYKNTSEHKRIMIENVKFNNLVRDRLAKVFGNENITES
jgi:DNA polymerase-3 subunit alpha